MTDEISDELAAGDEPVTTGQLSHRYLRLSLALVVLTLFVGVGVQIVRSGGEWMPSISHYFYTPAHNVFVASLISASLALVVLAGRDLETVFLDIAAIFAPLIALVPTGISPELLTQITGEQLEMGPCDPNGNCVPVANMEAIYNGVITYTIVVGCVVVLTLWVRRDTIRMLWTTRGDDGYNGHRAWAVWSLLAAPLVAIVVAIVLNLAAFVAPINEGFPFNPWLRLSVHFTATILFFGAFTIVPVINVFRYVGERKKDAKDSEPGGRPPTNTRYAIIYALVPALMIADIILLVLIVRSDAEGPGVLLCEAIALALFGVFWVAQTIQWWKEWNPPHLAATSS